MLIKPNAPSNILRVKGEIDQRESLKAKPDQNLLQGVQRLPVEARAAAKAEAVKVGALRGMDPGGVGASLGASLQGQRGALRGEGLRGKTKAL